MRRTLAPGRRDVTPDREELSRANERLEDATPQDILLWALGVYGEGLALSVSFGNPAGLILLDMLSRFTDRAQVFTLDTGFLFEQTVRFREETMKRYSLPLEVVTPGLTVAEPSRALRTGALRLQTGGLLRDPQDRAAEALPRGLRRLDYGDQPGSDAAARRHSGRLISRVLRGREDRAASPLDFRRRRGVRAAARRPLNPLFGMGYRSVGCEPCTRPVTAGEDARAGRWSGTEKTECGLHLTG